MIPKAATSGVFAALFAIAGMAGSANAALPLQPPSSGDAPAPAAQPVADSGLVFVAARDIRGGGSRGGGGGGNRGLRSSGNTNINHNVNANSNVNLNRNTNVNVNRNVNVNNNYYGHYNDHWDDHYHPVATAAAITATAVVTAAVVGSIVNSVPPSCTTVVVNGLGYRQCGSTWYQPQYAGTTVQYVVVTSPR